MYSLEQLMSSQIIGLQIYLLFVISNCNKNVHIQFEENVKR